VSVSIIKMERKGKPVSVHLLTNVSRQERMREALISIQGALKTHGMTPSMRETQDAAAAETPAMRRRSEEASNLTRREVEILKFMADGLSSQAIATRLVISHFTVRNHIQNLLCKLNVHSRAQAVSFGFTRGLF
jgi:DNA-binding NarL/FixJ family response regulator